MIFSIAYLYRRLGTKLFAACMLVMIVVQIIDLSAFRRLLVAVANRPAELVLDQAAWKEQVPDTTQYLYFFPKFKCGRGDQVLRTLMPTMRYAAVHNIKINTGYVSRASADCSIQSTQADLAASDFGSSVYVFNTGDFPQVEQVKQLFPTNRQPECKVLDFAHVCRVVQAGQVNP